MYRCQECHTTYDLSKEHLNYITEQCHDKGLSDTIVICPNCNKAHVSGGELDWDPISKQEIIIAYSTNLNTAFNKNFVKSETSLPAFLGVKIEIPTKEEDAGDCWNGCLNHHCISFGTDECPDPNK